MTENRKRELLQEYISGSISPINRHALEREALDDVFLFEALEGYSKYMKSPDLPFYKTEPNTVLPIRTFLTMAASFLVIAAFAFLIKQNINPTVNEKAIGQMESEPSVMEDDIAIVETQADALDLDANPTANKAQVLGDEILEKSKTEFTDINKRPENRTPKTNVATATSQDINVFDSKTEDHPNQENEAPVEAQLDYQEVISKRVNRAERSTHVTNSESKNKIVWHTKESADSNVKAKDSIQNTVQEKLLETNDGIVDSLKPLNLITELDNQRTLNQGMIYVSELPHKKSQVELTGGATEPAGLDGGRVIPGIRYSPEEAITADSLSSHNYRRVFPVGGWNLFNEELYQLKKQVSCKGMSFTFKFKILESGDMYDLELSQLPSIDQTGLVLECLVKTKSFIEEHNKWETVPPNRKVNRKLIINFDE